MTDVTIKHIQTFIAVADLGTFRRAAERLNTTQPNVSNRVAQLEQRLGVTLMERDAGSVRLTRKGDALLTAARSVMGALDTFIATAGDDTLFDDTLRLGVSELVAHTWLRSFLIEMRKRFPSVRVELTVDLSTHLSDALFARELDLVFQSGPFDREATHTERLGNAHYTWIASANSPLPRTLRAEHLAVEPILTHARDSAPYRELSEHTRQLQADVHLVPSSNIATCLQMVIDGLGIACLPGALVETALRDGRLRQLEYTWQPDDLHFAARHLVDDAPRVLREAIMLAAQLCPSDERVPTDRVDR